MPTKDQIDRITNNLNLTPYQTYMLTQNGHKYDMDKLVKRGDVLYAPYRGRLCDGFWDCVAQYTLGTRADLIGADRILIQNKRGIRLYPAGFFKYGSIVGPTGYLDNQGNMLDRSDFRKVVRL